MKIEQQVDQIIEIQIPAILSGEVTLESVLDQNPHIASELRPRLEAALWLRQASRTVEPRPGFISSSRRYIEHKVETLQPHGFWGRLGRKYTPQRWVFNVLSPILILLLLAFITNSVVLSARLSIPGDTLYPVKLATENIRLAFTFNPTDKANLHIQYSRDRTTEFVELVLVGNYETLPSAANRLESEIIASLHALNNIPSGKPDAEASQVANLRDTLSNEIFILNVLKSSSPATAFQGIELALQAAQSGLYALR